MTAGLSAVVTAYGGLVMVGAGWVLLRRRRRPAWLQAGVWTLLALLLLQAGWCALAVRNGHGPPEPALFFAYLAVSTALLPLCGALGDTGDSTTGADVGLVIATVALVVVQWRLIVTWRSVHG